MYCRKNKVHLRRRAGALDEGMEQEKVWNQEKTVKKTAGGARSRRSQTGTQATVSEIFHGGVTGERSHGGSLGGGTRDAGTSQLRRHGARGTLQAWRVTVELTAHGTEAEVRTGKG